MSRIVLVGEAPGPRHDGKKGAWDGNAADRLAAFMGLERGADVRERFECVNVLDQCPGKDGTGAWPAKVAREAAQLLVPLLNGRVVLIAGTRVAATLGVPYDPELVWGRASFVCGHQRWCPAAFATFPHPSGLNRRWNDLELRSRASAFLRRAAVLPAESFVDQVQQHTEYGS